MNMTVVFLLSMFSFASFASNHTATIVKLENSSVVYVPGEKNADGYKHVKYLGAVYHILPATKGFKLDNGFIVTTGPSSKAKVIFNNGDHLFISENTQYKIEWKRESDLIKKDPSVLNLIRGAVRGLIQKNGPRSGMKVESSSAVIGIRGTDFYVNEKHGRLSVSVMRGLVEIFSDKKDDRPVKVQTGQTLTKEGKVINITTIMKEDLQEIAQDSTIAVNVKEAQVEPEQEKELIELDKSATTVTLNDIKEYQPHLYKEISEKQSLEEMSSDSLALNTVKVMEEKAPSRSKKPTQNELDDETDPYENYKFKKNK